jgi:predicted TIM-barrel fold metal-dependent hydrolase
MKIIDTHTHLGDCRMCEYNNTEEDVIKAVNENKLTCAILQPFPWANEYRKTHERISILTKQHPNKFYGIISVNPHRPKKEFFSKVNAIMKLGGFVGIKLHTLGHAVAPSSSDAHNVYEIAREHRIPVMIHTGLTNFGEPALALQPAKQYPDVNFILAHCGWSGQASQTIVTALQADNIYLETSWTSIEEKASIISSLGSNRVMMGADTLLNIGVEIDQYLRLKIPENDLKNVFYKVAIKIFNLEL